MTSTSDFDQKPFDVLCKIVMEQFASLAPNSGRHSFGSNRMHLIRYDYAVDLFTSVMKPSLLVLFNSGSENFWGRMKISSRANDFALIGVQMPMMSHIDGSPENPLMFLVLNLDMKMLSEILATMPKTPPQQPQYQAYYSDGIAYGKLNVTLISHLIKLFEEIKETDSHNLVPPALLDLYKHLLQIPEGAILRSMVSQKNYAPSVTNSINYLTEKYNEDFTVETLAEVADMPTTTFHRYFKAMTSLSPMQYVKAIRLFEARRLMIYNARSAVDACQSVGYESASQFSREYKRAFARPPQQDVSFTINYTPPTFQPFAVKGAS